jgi:ferredoxin-nitrite reductase
VELRSVSNQGAAVRTGTNAVEGYKASKGGDGLRIREDLPKIIEQGHEVMTQAEKDLLKWVGVFFRNPTPGHFMMRIRMPNGLACAKQLRTIADLSRRLGNCVVDITTRQQVELRGFTLRSIPEIWERLRGVELHSLQTGMDNVRNICGCPLAGLTLNELIDASAIVLELEKTFVGAGGNPEFTNLPRKFNIIVTGCLENCSHAESQDIALVPALRSYRVGFNVMVGGKMGSGGFTVAPMLGVFVTPEDAAGVVAELVRVFRDHGPRDARAKCRFAFLVEEWGIPRLREELAQRLGRDLEPAGRDVRAHFHRSDHLGITRQSQPGTVAVGLRVPMGRMDPAQMEELATLAEDYGNGEIRLTTAQNAILPYVPDGRLDSLLDQGLLQEFTPAPSSFRRNVVACTGTDFCNLAQIDTKGHANELSGALEQRFGTIGAPLTMHWSGCPAGCGNHQAADIGFRGLKARIDGQIVEAVAIYVGGRTGPDAEPGHQVVEVVPCDKALPTVVAKVISDLGLYTELPSETPQRFDDTSAVTGIPATQESPLPID